ncbi:MAG: repressor LexA, partial [Anaerolineae bacterium]|nr:repressor LexA [Anaerolineae bacterium]
MLSQRQFDILKYIHRYSAENGFAPGIREISLTTAITSTSVVNYNL